MVGPEPNLRDLFSKAVQCQSAEEQAAYVEQACQGDAELRSRLEELLQAHQEAGSFLQEPSASPAATIDAAVPHELSGTVVGPYKLLQPIGEGGMGAVWMAQQTEPVKRLVALKLIKAGMDSKQVIARFEAERQALALMDHPNIAKVHDAGTTPDGRPFFVMELVKGVPITRYCDERRLTPRERLELFVPVCQAIQHAHQKGIIHRDIKPSNVMVTLYDGRPVPKVIDFGVAKATEQKLTERTLFTQYGTMVGTLEYMSPEQAEMSALGVDTRSDIYSLGVLLYELLTGNTPLTHMRMKEVAYAEILRMIKEVEPPRPSTRLSDSGEALASISANRHMEPAKLTKLVRGELDWIVMKTLEKDRNRRYETANGFAMDVLRYLNDEPVQACPPSKWYRFRKFARRNKTALAAALTVALVLLLAVIGLATGVVLVAEERGKAIQERDAAAKARDEETNARNLADRLRKLADEQRAAAEKLEKIAKEQKAFAEEGERTIRRNLYTAHMNLVQQAVELHDPARALRLLNLHRPQPGQDDLRSFEWYYWWGQCHRRLLRTLNGHTDTVHSVAFSPDGQTIASVGYDLTVRLWDAASGIERVSLRGHTQYLRTVAFSPDGRTLASGGREFTVKLWDVATGTARATLEGHEQLVQSVAFSPDGRTVASASADATIRLWDVATGKLKRILKSNQTQVTLAFSPDGKQIASGSRQSLYMGGGTITLWDLDTGKTRVIFASDENGACPVSVSYSADGKMIAAAISTPGEVKVWKVASGQLQATLKHGSALHTSAFSPDGKTLASGGEDRVVKVWDLATGEVMATLVGHGHLVYAVAFSPDKKTLASASADRTVKLWDLNTVGPKTFLHGHEKPVVALAFSPDGQTVASAGGDQTIKLWEVSHGDLKKTIKGHTDHITGLAFSPNGKVIASSSLDRTIKLWDAGNGNLWLTLEGPGILDSRNVLSPVAFSPDGKTVATSSQESAVKLWDADTGALKTVLKGHRAPVISVSFSLDGKTLASVGSWDYSTRLWDVASGKEKAILTSEERGVWPFWIAVFSPDGKTLATGGEPASLKLWDVATGKLKATLTGHAAAIRSVSFSPDGKTLASASHDRTIKIWDLATGEPRTTLPAGIAKPIAFFSPDGSILASSTDDGVKLWRAATEEQVRARDRQTEVQTRTKQ